MNTAKLLHTTRLVLLLAVFVPSPNAGGAEAKPNVILIMCDDLGYGDPQCFNPDSPIRTPHIDALATDGLTFTRFYAAAPVCSPTRGSCLTGRHPDRYGILFANVGHLPKSEVTLPELLKDRGYVSGHFGKWHLGTLTKTVQDANRGGPRGAEHFSPPRDHGYDESFVTESKVPTYDPMIKPAKANRVAWDYLPDRSVGVSYGTKYWNHDGSEAIENLQGDDSRIIMDRATEFVKQSIANDKAFFAAIWFHAPHLPVVAGPEHVEPYRSLPVDKRNYFGCVTAMDEQIGRLRQVLKQEGVSENTMIWFCSDNGPEGNRSAPGSAGNLRGRKRSLYEGGVRVPGFLVWPGEVQAGTETEFPAVTSDYLPTILEAVGLSAPDELVLDGVSLMSALKDPNAIRRAPIGFKSRRQWAWHEGNLKLITQNEGKKWELYDLEVDPAEKHDLAPEKPDQVRDMVAAFQAWQASLNPSAAPSTEK